MPVSVFELYSIGVGPSSSHTVGPMRAAKDCLDVLLKKNSLLEVQEVIVELYGSLAMTGMGHATDKAILMGLSGQTPEEIDPEWLDLEVERIYKEKTLNLYGQRMIRFNPRTQIVFLKDKRLPYHSNAMRFTMKSFKGVTLVKDVYYSVGGGFIVRHAEINQEGKKAESSNIPFHFSTYAELEGFCLSHNKTISEIIWENETQKRSPDEVKSGILKIYDVMKKCVERGVKTEGILPGGLGVVRRAPKLWKDVHSSDKSVIDPAEIFDWVSLFALAVNEENAAGGKVVTAPTNGAAGVIPAVLHYYEKFIPSYSHEGLVTFFLTSCAIGTLYKFGASLSAAEMGCQGEVGVASSMAAAGLTAALGGTNSQIENAAEIAMEHHLGLTCDPIGGLVQIPCIERNTMGAIKAINASRLALKGEGDHKVRLDQVIKAMREVGIDMHAKYKETSVGGLAISVPVSIPEC